jgi:hypothetical protein
MLNTNPEVEKKSKSERNKEWYLRNREKILERRRKKYEENKDEFHQKKKEYREKNLEKLREYEREYSREYYAQNKEFYKTYYERNKDKILEYHKTRRDETKEKRSKWQAQYNATKNGRAHKLVTGYKYADKRYGRGECTLTAQWIVDNIFSKPCVHCGETDWHKLGCNRLDNTKPHTEDNVEPCCSRCNIRLPRKHRG